MFMDRPTYNAKSNKARALIFVCMYATHRHDLFYILWSIIKIFKTVFKLLSMQENVHRQMDRRQMDGLDARLIPISPQTFYTQCFLLTAGQHQRCHDVATFQSDWRGLWFIFMSFKAMWRRVAQCDYWNVNYVPMVNYGAFSKYTKAVTKPVTGMDSLPVSAFPIR